MHEQAYAFVARTVLQLPARRFVIELGSRTVAGPWPCSGPVRPLFPGASYVGVDAIPGPNVDEVGDAASWQPAPRFPADTVVCTETLEHAEHADRICANAATLLAAGGVFIVTAAGVGRVPHSAIDGGELREGEYYRNVARDCLERWLSPFGFAMVDTFSHPGDIYALAVKLEPGR